MNSLALVSILWGILFIISRAPLLFAPRVTIGIYRRMLSTSARIRIMGIFITALSLVTFISAQNSDLVAAEFFLLFSWILTFFSVFILLIFPAIYKKILDFALNLFSESITSRVMMIIPIGLGVFLIYLGIVAL